MTEDEIAEMKLKESLLQAMRRNGGSGVARHDQELRRGGRAGEHDQAECLDDGGRLYIREPA
jgi:hypothetical protein